MESKNCSAVQRRQARRSVQVQNRGKGIHEGDYPSELLPDEKGKVRFFVHRPAGVKAPQ